MTDNQSKSLELILTDFDDAHMFLGTHDKHIKFLEESTHVMINSRGEVIQSIGESSEIELVVSMLRVLQTLIQRGIKMHTPDVVPALKMVKTGNSEALIAIYEEEIMKDHHGWATRIKNVGQKKYIDAVKTHDVTFGAGPAGTGKAFLIVVMVVAALRKGEVQKIILTRPAVEAGESLGSLPGDSKEKADPYSCPIHGALYQILGMDHINCLMECGIIEVAPLAYMRGRTLDDAFVILNKAQNTMVARMKMFLTHLGSSSKMIVNGDTSQIDLLRGVTGGLVNTERMLKDIEKIAFVNFEASDVVRHPVVAQTIQAYEKEQQKHFWAVREGVEVPSEESAYKVRGSFR